MAVLTDQEMENFIYIIERIASGSAQNSKTREEIANSLKAFFNTATQEIIGCAATGELSIVTVGTKLSFFSPKDFTLSEVTAGVNSPQTSGGALSIDVRKNGVSVFGAQKLIIDNNESHTGTASLKPVVNASTKFKKYDLVDIVVLNVGTGAAGLKVWLLGV